MRALLWILGIAMILYGSLNIGRYVLYYGELSEFGKGFLWGNVILFFSGLSILYSLIRHRRKDSQK